MLTAIVYATHEMGGLGFKDIHVTQLIEHLKVLLDHGPTVTGAGKSLRITAEATTIEREDVEETSMMPMQLNIHGWILLGYGSRFRI